MDDHIRKCMEKILTKFSNINFFNDSEAEKLKQIKDYKTIYEYKGEKYKINTIDYIYIFQQSLLNVTRAYNYSSLGDSIYLDVFQNMLKNKKPSFVNYAKVLFVKKTKNNFIVGFSRDEKIPMLENLNISPVFRKLMGDILNELFFNNNKLKLITIPIIVDYNMDDMHSELIIFQIVEKKLYIINYDPAGSLKLGNIMDEFLIFLTEITTQIIDEYKIDIEVKSVHKKDLEFEIYKGEKTGGLQKITNNIDILDDSENPNQGICENFTFFILYCLVYIFYSSKIPYPCDEIIKKIEYLIYITFFTNEENEKKFSNIIINFSNYISDYYYNYSILQITENKTQEEKVHIKKNFQFRIETIFSNLFKCILLDKIHLNKYTEEKDIDTLKSSGYFCIENKECSSNNCVNNHCYIDEKEVEPEDIRNTGNPCLYNIQCRSGDCKDYICTGDVELEEAEFYDECYDSDEILEPEDLQEILDSNSSRNYLNM